MATKRIAIETTAEAYLILLKSRGVDYFFGNAGTDFAPLVGGTNVSALSYDVGDLDRNHGRWERLRFETAHAASS